MSQPCPCVTVKPFYPHPECPGNSLTTVNATMEVQVFTGQERMSDEILVSQQPVFLCHISEAYSTLCIFFFYFCIQGAVIGPQHRRSWVLLLLLLLFKHRAVWLAACCFLKLPSALRSFPQPSPCMVRDQSSRWEEGQLGTVKALEVKLTQEQLFSLRNSILRTGEEWEHLESKIIQNKQ